MAPPVPQGVFRKVCKLAQLPEEVRRSRWAVSVTRLTTLKGLCQEPEAANRFVTYLARKTLGHVERGQRRSGRLPPEKARAHRQMMAGALTEMEAWLQAPTEARRQRLWDLLGRIRDEQNEYENIKWGAVRLVRDWELLLFEYALRCLLGPPREAGSWAYQAARHYAERYDPRHGTGLIPESAPLVQDIADFWAAFFGIAVSAPRAQPGQGKTPKEPRSQPRAGSHKKARLPAFTPRQGQFLAFIHLYRKLHRQGPAELDMAQFFGLTPPAVHGMVVKLEQLGLITREPGVARSVRVAIPAGEVPALADVEGPLW
jgi:hypothetical protein